MEDEDDDETRDSISQTAPELREVAQRKSIQRTSADNVNGLVRYSVLPRVPVAPRVVLGPQGKVLNCWEVKQGVLLEV